MTLLLVLALFSCVVCFHGEHSVARADDLPNRVLIVDANGPITPAAADLFEDAILTAERGGFHAVLFRLDTPGGLVSSMRDIVATVLNAHVPVLVWVGPAGARAASAGVFIVAASHIAAMSPQTTMGAASPVGIGGSDVGKTMESKIMNDMMSFVRTLAETRGRNAQWYEKSVSDAESLTSQEAVMSNVVDMMALSEEDLLEQANGRTVSLHGEQRTLDLEGATLVDFDPGIRHSLLSWLLNPEIAYLLMLGGMAGLFFELSTPGAVLPGVFGGICLLLALYSLSILPTSTAGLLLILFAVVLFVLEIYITSFGMLGIAGLVSLFVGSVILIRPEPGIAAIPLGTIIVTVGTLALIMGSCLYVITKAQRRSSVHGVDALVGMTGRVTEWDKESGRIFIRGELWSAISDADITISSGDTVLVTSASGLVLVVEPYEEV